MFSSHINTNTMRSSVLYPFIMISWLSGFYLITLYKIHYNDSLNNVDNNDLKNNATKLDKLERKKRFLFIFPFYRILPGYPCRSAGTNFQGVCLSQRQCNARGGVCSGSCANSKGVCCVYQKSCGQSSNANITYFVNPNFPSSYNEGGTCILTINKINAGICQLRLDFLSFSIAEPDDGVCKNDTLSLGNQNLPKLCGVNDQDGQHVYIDLNPSSNSHSLTVSTLNTLSLNRRWNIQISQIACNSSNRAPYGCLKYYRSSTGSDYSFNYSPSPAISSAGLRNRQLVGLNYGVCVRPEFGHCGIKWSQATGSNTFSVSGDATATALGLSGTSCTSNYIVVPNAFPDDNSQSNNYVDRFCGTTLTSMKTNSKPFVLTVVTAASGASTATTNVDNKGFHLNFEQTICTQSR